MSLITEKEEAAIEKFKREHSLECSLKPVRSCAIDVERFEVRVRQNSVCHTVALHCDCGASFNCTDYSVW